MNLILSELWIEVFKYLNNENIYSIQFISSLFYKLIYSKYFQIYFKNRKHPLTFNNIDNFCTICNINIILLDKDLNIIRCQH
jgi:hypothetical protein